MSLKNVTTPEKNVAVLECDIDAATFSAAVTAVYNKKKGDIQLPGFRKG
ncbi:MAG: trigger factor, partial [Eubacteriales bacterium]